MAETDNEQLKVNINGGIFPIWWLRKKSGITTDLLNDKVITTAKLADGAVTEDKLAAAVKDLIDGKAGTTYVNTELAKKMDKADYKVLQFNGFVDNVTIENSSVGTVTVSDIKYDKTHKYFVALKDGKYYRSWSTPASSDYNVYSSGWKTANNAFINIGTGDMEAPKMAQFGGYVDNVTIETYSGPIPIPGVAKDIFWDTTHQKFVIKVVSGTAPLTSTHYYDDWATKSLYHNADGSLTNNVYVDVSTKSLASEVSDIAQDVSQIKEQITEHGIISTPVVDNLTSDETTSALSAKQGKVLKTLVDSKANSTDIPAVPTIADNLTTDDATKTLSAKQGKVLNDALASKANTSAIPTKTSDLTNDSQFITQEYADSFVKKPTIVRTFPTNNIPVDNRVYVLGLINSLTIAGTPDDNRLGCDIYFQTPSDVTDFLSIPVSVKYVGVLTIKATASYIMSIQNGTIVLVEEITRTEEEG